jgi:transketolase
VQSIVRKDGPTALILTRQNVKVLPIDVKTKREGVAKGAYIAHKETVRHTTLLSRHIHRPDSRDEMP